MALVTTNTNLTSVSYTAGELITIQNGATLTYDTQHTVRPGTIRCITSGKFKIVNTSTTVPIVLELENMNQDLIFQSNGVFEIRGNMIELGTGTGAAQTFDFNALFSGKITDITYIEVESSPGSNDYFPWHIAEIAPKYYHIGRFADRGSTPTDFDPNQEVFFWHSGIRSLQTGDNTNGKSVPSGCKIRIPNILITNQDWQIDTTLAHRIVSEGVPTGGTFTITITNRRTGVTLGTTSALAFNATAAQIDTAIEGVLGAGTITNSGGPLPTTANMTLSGSFANTPLAFQVNSSVTGGTNPIIYSLEASAGSLSLLNLNPSGTIDAECCMFSRKIRFTNSAFASQKFLRVGASGDGIQIQGSNGSLDYDHFSYTPNVYTAQTQNIPASAIFGDVKFNKFTLTQSSCQSPATIQVLPNCTKLDDVRILGYGNRSSATGSVMNLQTIPSIAINRLRIVGGRSSLQNLVGNIFISPKSCDTSGSTQLSANATSAFVIANSKDLIFSNTGKCGTTACRNTVFNTDTQSSNIKVIGGSYDATNNCYGVAASNGDTLEIINFALPNTRSGSVLVDMPSSFATKRVIGKKIFGTTTVGGVAFESAQDSKYDLISGTINSFNTANISIQNFVGGNIADPGLTPITGHVTFGAFGSGEGMTTSGSAYTSQTGNVTMVAGGDSFIAQIPFSMHAITSFQNVTPQYTVQGYGVFANLHTIINEGGITGGTFTISVYNTSNVLVGTTSALAYNSSTTTIDTALEAIVGAGVSVAGTMAAGINITMPTAYVCRLEVDGSLLTGGAEPGVLYVYGRAVPTPLITNMGTNFTFEYQVRNGGETTWPVSWNALSGANLSSAISSLTSYDPNTSGLDMRIRVTVANDDKYRTVSQISLPTNISPSAWTVDDSSIQFNGLNLTDNVDVVRVSDSSVLYTFTGAGLKNFSLGLNYNTEVFFERKDSLGNLLMQSKPFTKFLSFGDNGIVNLFYGQEIQLAESSDVTAIKAAVDLYLDAAISSRCSQVTGDSIKKDTVFIKNEV